MIIEDHDPALALAPPPAYAPTAFRIKWADSAWEVQQARALRRAVFVDEQKVFDGDDVDAVDAHAQTIVAVSALAGMPDQVVGTVRIHEHDDGLWWGSRLAVRAGLRHHGRIGSTLITLAVRSAHARGCRVFLAHVQVQNVVLFQKLRWQLLKEEELHGRPHALMQADLTAYPPCHDPITGIVARSAP
jgi:putative N-acetyltransferase (TIGR04045 family)